MRRYEVKTEEAFKKVQEIIDANVFYDLEVIKDPEEFVVVAPIDQECIYEYENLLGEHRRINLKEICLGYQLKDDQQLFLMATKSGVNYAVKEFGAKKLNS